MILLWDIFKASRALQGIVLAIVALVGFKGWQIRERNIGARVAIEKVEKANDKAITVGNAGAGKSGVPGVRGQRDPTTRNDAPN